MHAMAELVLRGGRVIDPNEILTLVRTTDDILRAKQENKTGVIFGFQNAHAFEDNLGYIEAFADMGVRVVQLCYNTQNLVGTGCYERDGGLSDFGREVITELPIRATASPGRVSQRVRIRDRHLSGVR